MERTTLLERTNFSGTLQEYKDFMISGIKDRVGDKKILCALSGGVDSSVCAAMVHKAVGDQLVCIFVDNGLMRKNEPEYVEEVFGGQFHMNLKSVDASDRFLDSLKGVEDPEKKRKAVGEIFIRVFEDEAKKLGKIDFLVQGTIYPDILESKNAKGVIKSHHNVGGLPEHFDFELVEPIKYLFKDEVRNIGLMLGIPKEQVFRQPFPGPGLSVRVLGEVTEEKLAVLREADSILREEIALAGLDKSIWQYFTVLPDIKTVGMKDGARTYGHAIAIRAVHSEDAMTAGVAEIPYSVLSKICSRITTEVPSVNRVMYDITPKPPGTIEWE